MTIEEMSVAIEDYCNNGGHVDCTECKMYPLVKDGFRNCHSYIKGDAVSEAIIKENYNFLCAKGVFVSDEPAETIPEPDMVNHPSHYCQEGSMECIDEMIAVFGREAVMNFCLLNVWKYRKRAVFKNGAEDLKKSDWYMKKYIELNKMGCVR